MLIRVSLDYPIREGLKQEKIPAKPTAPPIVLEKFRRPVATARSALREFANKTIIPEWLSVIVFSAVKR